MPTKWYESEVISIKTLSPQTKEFVLKVSEEEIFSFLPGQFVTMDLPLGEKRYQRWRSYSIANAPNQKNLLEFCIVRFEDGLGSCYFHDVVKKGDIIKWKGPDGGFVLPENNTGPLILISTGTGIAPFRSMLQDLFSRDAFIPPIHLIFGTRKEEDILYGDELEYYSKRYPEFSYSITLSREKKPGFIHGYVHEVYMNPDYNIPDDALIYLCGWSKMIDQAVELLLLRKKVRRDQIKYELYG
ncbi:MAG: oxidoreductase [Saprospiraceae bacterium]|jgi:CDP-4-dehydro-6-deoxyglucose reductase|nr:oxidoreductase [Saprospiraceae bacterium]MBK8547337.1 oxidoreductase [Saprospiraceae bacterium]MBK8818549.1 oxidoreductase [Saprospiraceae bacterium]MBK8852680.1 oxidoreductase [Saprospiraceae bacterium]MBK9042326.1 oxidoreductase [Saprospiraceae bacterium]